MPFHKAGVFTSSLNESRELKTFGRNHRSVIAIAEVDCGLREPAAAALLEFRAEKNCATGGRRGCSAVGGAYDFALLLKIIRICSYVCVIHDHACDRRESSHELLGMIIPPTEIVFSQKSVPF